MKSFLYIPTRSVVEIRDWISREAKDGYYTQGGNSRSASPQAGDFLPEWVRWSYEGNLPSGGTVLDGGMMYSSCAGNWVTVSNAGEIRIGGARHGIVIENWLGEGVRWDYPPGGTMTPDLAPWEHPTPERALHLEAAAKKVEIEALPPEIKEGLASLKKLTGTRQLRKQQWIVKQLGEEKHQRLFG